MAVLLTALASGTSAVQTQPLVSVSAPAVPVLSTSGTGATLPTATYYVKLTYVYSITYNGRTWSQETVASSEANLAVTLGANLVITSPTWATGATKVNVYVSSATGTEQYQGQITTSAGTLTISAPLSTTSYSPATTNFSSGNNTVPTTATTAQIVYQAPGLTANVTAPSATCYIKELEAVNTSATATTLTLYIVPSGGVASASNSYAYSSSTIPANDSKIFSGLNKCTSAGSTIQAIQGTAGAITLDISVQEIQ